MGHWELPLVLFTVLSQAAVGIVLCLWFFKAEQPLLKKALIASGALLVAAFAMSLFHLGQPMAAYRALSHLGTSWLSREILLFILMLAGWVFVFLNLTKANSAVKAGLGLTAVLGILGVISSAMIYTLPRVPAWNNAAPVLFFLLTVLVLGTLITAVLGGKNLSAKVTGQLQIIALASLVGSAVLFILYFSVLDNTAEGLATAQFLLSSPLFWLRAIIGWIIPILLLSNAMTKPQPQPTMIMTVLACGIVGELLGRALFYGSAVGIQITALF